ncbi:ABC transporter ATP-binding protein [Janibacter sp. G349]|uniref:ABC transporter ATP-binding protein n=1 Tax=unclassified Janibacter TaxID=2649294 RepID=UPI0020CF3B37|nr:ABC transporter ATP-binding protein [Janibacter sp. CX7]UTT65107.1 ABC transporter ATP-binding protein [Janibacter sp. CX7]
MTSPSLVSARQITVGYGGEPVIRGLDLDIARGDFTVVVGPNGCGKSTLLKALCRVNQPSDGRVELGGDDLHRMRGRAVAQRVSLLPQSAIAPEGITVGELVTRGRHPHHSLLRQWSPDDDRAIAAALDRTHLTDLADTPVATLSGGQRQRAWVAMVLAQDTEVILLDEPTTFLDIAHQYELLELFAGLNREGRTIVAVLHDLNQAARFASRLVVMHEGRIRGDGPPAQVLTSELVEEVFGLACDVVDDPQSGTPMVVPHVRQQPLTP